MVVAKTRPMLTASAPPASPGLPLAVTASVPRLARLAQSPSAPTVPAGSTVTQIPPAIITSAISTWAKLSATRRRIRPW